jgi:hypothetical protein
MAAMEVTQSSPQLLQLEAAAAVLVAGKADYLAAQGAVVLTGLLAETLVELERHRKVMQGAQVPE